MTAVEWLKEKYFYEGELFVWDFAYALELEEKQIIEAYETNRDINTIQTAEEYYNETYKKDKP